MCAHRLPNPIAATLHKLHGLRATDIQAAIVALQVAPADCTVDQHEDSEGDLMLMITPPGHEDTTPTFVLSGTAAGVQLDVALGDSCDSLGTFADLRQAVLHARQVMMTSTADMQVVA